MEGYKHSRSAVGSNRKHLQITPKYRYKMMQKEKLKVFCKVAIEEACRKHKIELEIVKIMSEHVHMVIDVPRTMCDAKAVQIVKGLSSYLLFRICPNLRKRYSKDHISTEGYICDNVGTMDISEVFAYIGNQEYHHATQ